jgi:hypothetical protein
MLRGGRLVGLLLLVLAGAWSAFWGSRFFEARGEAEAAMDRLQPLLAAGFSDPALAAQVEAALERSHEALAFAVGGPVAVAMMLFAGLWFAGRRGS